MARESERITIFAPKKLTDKEKAELQAGMLTTYRVNVQEQNAACLARYHAMKNNGAWAYENYIDNFGEDEECLANAD